MLIENINQVKEKIHSACQSVDRSPEEVILIAVSKTKPPELMMEAMEAGITHFGENYVQEFCAKYPLIHGNDRVTWHFIGSLQTNKVKYIIDKADYIHSVDRVKLLAEINKKAGAIGKCQKVLIEVNVTGEESKEGASREEAEEILEFAKVCEHIEVCGLMTMAPLLASEKELHEVFAQLRQLSIDFKPFCCNNITMTFLSMGMSGDYPIAIQEGANMVRVGTAIFGKR